MEIEAKLEANRDWRSAVLIRPYHLNQKPLVEALCGGSTRLSLSHIASFYAQRSQDLSHYTHDVVGKSMLSPFKFVRSEANFYKQLRNMEDEAVVDLDLGKDGICESCIVGRHCDATNYSSLTFMPPVIDSVYLNQKTVLDLRNSLVNWGFIEGTDFATYQKEHTVYDFRGHGLDKCENPTPKTIEFTAMRIPMGNLRSIALQFYMEQENNYY